MTKTEAHSSQTFRKLWFQRGRVWSGIWVQTRLGAPVPSHMILPRGLEAGWKGGSGWQGCPPGGQLIPGQCSLLAFGLPDRLFLFSSPTHALGKPLLIDWGLPQPSHPTLSCPPHLGTSLIPKAVYKVWFHLCHGSPQPGFYSPQSYVATLKSLEKNIFE